MAKWFEIQYRAANSQSEYHKAHVRIHFGDVCKPNYEELFGNTGNFDVHFQGNAQDSEYRKSDPKDLATYYGSRLDWIDCEPEYITKIAATLRRLANHRPDLSDLICSLLRNGYRQCVRHSKSDRYYPIEQFPALPYWSADNNSTHIGVFATDSDEAKRLLLKEFARKASADNWTASYAQTGLEAWLSAGKPVTNHGVQTLDSHLIVSSTPEPVTA